MNERVIEAALLPADECFELVRITLRRAGCSAVVAELRAADVLVARWAAHGGERKRGFELTFDDGCSLRGSYDYGGLKRAKPSLSRFMRKVFKSLRQVSAAWPCGTQFVAAPTADPSRYVIEGL